jgi:hypothetical protein
MKKVLLTIVLFVSIIKVRADEGMWLPLLLGQQVYNDMVKKGLKLSAEQLYSINKSSIKDAIIIFGGGCTGEIVSDKGLIFTNHHCGYDAIASASSVTSNYLRDGFYAKSLNAEIQTKLTVQFLNEIKDVTAEVNKELGSLTGADRTKKQAEVLKAITDKVLNTELGITGRVTPMFKNNQFLLFVYQTYSDIRLVGTPPESIGKFGGDTDNWEWPRHTGDFSIFRVYADAKGNPAKFDPNNKPLKPKHFLPVSLKGVNDGDYAMIYGYPGGTNRYETSYGVKMKTDISNPTLVSLRDMRLKNMYQEMIKDPAVKLKLASSYAGIANYWKFFDGETKQLLKFKTYEQKQKEEAKFISWAKGKPEFENIFKDYEANYQAWQPYENHRVNIAEGITGSTLLTNSSALFGVAKLLEEGKDATSAIANLDKARADIIASWDKPSDERIIAQVLQMYYNNVDKAQQPAGLFDMLATKYGNLSDDASFKAIAKDALATSVLTNDELWNSFKANPTADALKKDVAFTLAQSILNNYTNNYGAKRQAFTQKDAELGRLYLKGIMEMNPAAAKKMYPDANFTMRVSYGHVKSYNPRDAVFYDYVCTSQGLLQKYKKDDYEFHLQDYIVNAVKRRDFGQYIDKKRNDLVISFITTNDITGGNSGSPVMNGKGELIGLAFDGNYEALSHKIAFDKDLNRTICVDIRYVLWCVDKLGGAKNIINELKLSK